MSKPDLVETVTLPLLRIEVDSGNVKAMSHDAFCNLLEVEFHSSAVYQYHPVSAAEHVALYTADSIGGHLNSAIKSVKACRRIER